jgi:hypothetical protein
MFSNKLSSSNRNLLLFLLLAWSFSFAHSELGMFEFDGPDHEQHDYCEIVQNAYPKSSAIRDFDFLISFAPASSDVFTAVVDYSPTFRFSSLFEAPPIRFGAVKSNIINSIFRI